ncbi:MAG: indole-3-glycerol-phosphate synthase [Promethearchaeota archaeon]|nr:MAG: indole-3-glycerol-phosphate synthase [Candidatus Lokiarchaeota archaeon]
MTSLSNTIMNIVDSRKISISKDLKYYNSIKKGPSSKRETLTERIRKNENISIISEIKPKSPTLGNIRQNMDVKAIVRQMESSGVIGLSVLTEPNFFNGSYENLRTAIKSTNLPCLMKDFIIDEIQLKIAKEIGTTNILLINSIIDLSVFYPLCLKYNLEPLIEIHELSEIEDIRYLIDIGFNPKLIGVNNRNLKNLEIRLQNSLNIIPKLKQEFGYDKIIISESGINTYKDIEFLKSAEADAFLVGSSIMKSKNIRKKIRQLRGIY